MMKRVFTLLLLVMSAAVSAEDSVPALCQPITVQEESVMLKTKQAEMVLIHNLSSSDLWITHPVTDPGASAGWSSRLDAGNWSALMVDKESFELSCIESKPGHEQQVPCASVITLCEWSGVKIPAQTTGTFWVGENMLLPSLIAHVSARGFTPAK